jgi:hypothetical protein
VPAAVPSAAERGLATALACIALCIASPVHAEQVTLLPAKDNTIFEESTNLSNGRGNSLFAGNTDMGFARRALVQFDIAAGVPAGSTVTSVRMSLQMTKTIVGGQAVRLHRVLADWGEGMSNAAGEEGRGATAMTGDATWQHRFFNTEVWTNRGGDFADAASATQQVSNNGRYTWGSTPELIADVQGWIDAPATNFGWIVIGNETRDPTAKRFASLQNTAASARPMLVIEFTPGAGGATPTPTATVTEPTATIPSEQPTATATPTAADTATPSATAEVTTPAASQTPTTTATVEATVEATATATPDSTATPIASATATAPATPTATPEPSSCAGDCDDSGIVTINELIVGVNIALGNVPASECSAFDVDGSDTVTINELVAAVRNAATGCGA